LAQLLSFAVAAMLLGAIVLLALNQGPDWVITALLLILVTRLGIPTQALLTFLGGSVPTGKDSQQE
jgi:hypothetical protein